MATIALDDLQTDKGCLQHLLAAESLGPFDSAYNFDQIKIVLRAMNAALKNRHALTKPWIFCASTASTIRDIICAPISQTGCQGKQFEGFSKVDGKVQITLDISSRIADLVRVANDATDSRQAKASQHLQEIITVVNGLLSDPYSSIPGTIGGVKIKAGVFGWKTAGASPPGGSFIKIPQTNPPLSHPDGMLQKTQFYTIREDIVKLSQADFLKSVFV